MLNGTARIARRGERRRRKVTVRIGAGQPVSSATTRLRGWGKGSGAPPAVAAAKAGRARFTGVNSGGGERTGDGVRVEHPGSTPPAASTGRPPDGAPRWSLV